MFRLLKRWLGLQSKGGNRIVDAMGMEVFASTRAIPTKSFVSTDTIEITYTSDELAEFGCGHKGPRAFGLNIYGEEVRNIIHYRLCMICKLEEARRIIIRCVRCGRPIFPHQDVSAYHSVSDGLRKDIGYQVGDTYLGCMADDCCPSQGLLAGTWTGERFEPAFLDGNTAAEQTMANGKPVFIPDRND